MNRWQRTGGKGKALTVFAGESEKHSFRRSYYNYIELVGRSMKSMLTVEC